MEQACLISPEWFNAIGLFLNFFGVLGIWVYGLPERIRSYNPTEGVRTVSGAPEGNPFAMQAGVSITLVLVGFALQFWANIAY